MTWIAFNNVIVGIKWNLSVCIQFYNSTYSWRNTKQQHKFTYFSLKTFLGFISFTLGFKITFNIQKPIYVYNLCWFDKNKMVADEKIVCLKLLNKEKI